MSGLRGQAQCDSDCVLPRAHETSSGVGVNASANSRTDTARLNRGYAVRSIDANPTSQQDHQPDPHTITSDRTSLHGPTRTSGYIKSQPVSDVFGSHP